MDNEEFKLRVRNGELEKRRVISDLYREEYRYLRRWTERLLYRQQVGRRPLDAEDLIQDVFISFFDTCEEFEGSASLRTYLLQAILHKVMDNTRASPVTMVSANANDGEKDLLQNLTASSNPEASVAAKLCMEKVLPALQDSHDSQTLLTYELIIVEGRTYPELANLLKVSEVALRQRISAVMRTLRSLIDKLCGGLS
jgi:RNA polymerase sigma factor (sigma-70 family)